MSRRRGGRPGILAISLRVGLILAGALGEAGRAVASPAWSSTREAPHPGVSYEVWRGAAAPIDSLERGSAATDRWQVVVGAPADSRSADSLLAAVEALGLAPRPVYAGGRYEIRLLGLASATDGDRLVTRLTEAGLGTEARLLRVEGPDLTLPDGPFVAHVLVLPPDECQVAVAHADDAAIGVETTRDLAWRHGAFAAINGGYYLTRGALMGDSEGVLVVDGRLLSSPAPERGAVGLWSQAGRRRAVLGPVGWRGRVRGEGGAELTLTGINQGRATGDVVLYTPEFHRSTLTEPGGIELVAAGGRLLALRSGRGSSHIPADGFVVSLGPEPAARFPRQEWPVGSALTLDLALDPRRPDPEQAWSRATSALGGGPMLLIDGHRVASPAAEGIARVFSEARHPRTAIGLRRDGALLLVVVDGRQPDHSAGMSLAELTDFLLGLGAVEALNLDGGGSSTMVMGGRTVNRPSDPTGERENGDALLVHCAAGPPPEAEPGGEP